MINLIALAVGIGLVVSLIFSELFAISAGGMVAAGYIALYLNRPVDVALTLAASLLTVFVVKGISRFVIIYGKRQVVAMILVGYLAGISINAVCLFLAPMVQEGLFPTRLTALPTTIGFIIPGLIAIWIERQGAMSTLSALLTGSVIVRLVLILLVGADLPAFGELL